MRLNRSLKFNKEDLFNMFPRISIFFLTINATRLGHNKLGIDTDEVGRDRCP